MAKLEMKYFVLKPRSKHAADYFAAASREAMRRYAEVIENWEPEFAQELKNWADKETEYAKKLWQWTDK